MKKRVKERQARPYTLTEPRHYAVLAQLDDSTLSGSVFHVVRSRERRREEIMGTTVLKYDIETSWPTAVDAQRRIDFLTSPSGREMH